MKEPLLCPQLPTLGVLFEPTPAPVVSTTSTTWLSALSREFLASVPSDASIEDPEKLYE
jgi:hypothetical protein